MKDNNSSKTASVGCSDKLQEMRASCFVFPDFFLKKKLAACITCINWLNSTCKIHRNDACFLQVFE